MREFFLRRAKQPLGLHESFDSALPERSRMQPQLIEPAERTAEDVMSGDGNHKSIIRVQQRRLAMKRRAWLLTLLCAIPTFSAWAAYTANHRSTVSWVKIYNNDVIYFRLDDQPGTLCQYGYFVLSSGVTEKQRDRYYAMLLTAKAVGNSVEVGYDSQSADCYAGGSIVHALSW